MYFTQEDYRKIEAWLYQRTIRDTDFPKALPVNGSEQIPILQDSKNKVMNFNDFVKQVAIKRPSDFYNVNKAVCRDRLTLSEAIASVPVYQRKNGLVITFCNEHNNWLIYQFIGSSIDQWDSPYCWENIISQALKDLIFWPDEEDITKVRDGNKIFLKFKNRDYNPDEFVGMGMVILRRNPVGTESCAIDDEDHLINLLTQDMINKPNTVYVIEYDFDLDGKSISIPENCTLWFQGGTINNGSICLKETAILGAFEFADMGDAKLIGTFNTGQVMTFSDDSYMKKEGGYFSAVRTLRVSTDVMEEFHDINPDAYKKTVRQELRWWNGEEWLLILDITDYNEIKSVINDLIDKHNAEMSACYKYFKDRCTLLETRMTNAENRLTNAENRLTNAEGRLDEHDTTLSNHESRISKSETRLDNAENRITNTEQRLNSHDNTLANHEGRIENAEGRLTSAENRITSTETRISNAEGRLDSHDSTLTNHETRISNSESRLTTLEDKSGDLDEALQAEIKRAKAEESKIAETLRTFLEDVDTKDTTINKWTEIKNFLDGITDTETLVGLLKDVSDKASEANNKLADQLAQEIQDRINADKGLQSQITTNATNISNLQETVNNHTTEISNISTRLSTAETNITNLQNDVNSLDNSVKNINSSVETINTNIENIQNTISSLQTTITNLPDTINQQLEEYFNNNIVGAKSVTVNGEKYDADSKGNITLPNYPSHVESSNEANHASSADNSTNADVAGKVAKKLKFTGAATGEYDGSAEVTINIPSGSSGGGSYEGGNADSADKVNHKLKFTGVISDEYDGSKEVVVDIPITKETVDRILEKLDELNKALGGSENDDLTVPDDIVNLKPLDLVVVNQLSGELDVIRRETILLSGGAIPTGFTKVGYVVVPTSHNLYGDYSAAILSNSLIGSKDFTIGGNVLASRGVWDNIIIDSRDYEFNSDYRTYFGPLNPIKFPLTPDAEVSNTLTGGVQGSYITAFDPVSNTNFRKEGISPFTNGGGKTEFDRTGVWNNILLRNIDGEENCKDAWDLEVIGEVPNNYLPSIRELLYFGALYNVGRSILGNNFGYIVTPENDYTSGLDEESVRGFTLLSSNRLKYVDGLSHTITPYACLAWKSHSYSGKIEESRWYTTVDGPVVNGGFGNIESYFNSTVTYRKVKINK